MRKKMAIPTTPTTPTTPTPAIQKWADWGNSWLDYGSSKFPTRGSSAPAAAPAVTAAASSVFSKIPDLRNSTEVKQLATAGQTVAGSGFFIVDALKGVADKIVSPTPAAPPAPGQPGEPLKAAADKASAFFVASKYFSGSSSASKETPMTDFEKQILSLQQQIWQNQEDLKGAAFSSRTSSPVGVTNYYREPMNNGTRVVAVGGTSTSSSRSSASTTPVRSADAFQVQSSST
jgi:hypothetical protein